MPDRARYDSAMFWLAFGTAASVIGLALMTIGASRSAPGANLLSNPWFEGGLCLLAVGGLLLLWALLLYVARRRVEAKTQIPGSSPSTEQSAPADKEAEAVRGYFAERERLFKMWYSQERKRRKRDGGSGA